MSRIFKVMVALLAIAAIAAPVMAEDRLGLGGEMRVRGWFDDDAAGKTNTWADQRLRIGGKLSIAEGVSVTFRTDITETKWGDDGSSYGAGRMGDTQQWDRAHLDLTMGSFSLRAGQQYVGLGLSQVVNSQDAGVSIKISGPMTFTAFGLLDDDNNDADTYAYNANGITVTEGSNKSDAFLYGLGLAHKGNNYASSVFFAGHNNGAAADVYVVGADLTLSLEAIKLMGQFDYFFGDATATKDAMGAQLLLDGSLAASELMTVGAQFYYALAADNDEVQYQVLGNDFNGWDPIMDVGTDLSNEAIDYGRPFDFTGDGAGVIGGRLYTKIKASDAVNFGASVAYLTPEDDGKTDIDADLVLAAGLTYAVMANTSLQTQVQYVDTDADVSSDELTAGVGLFVKF